MNWLSLLGRNLTLKNNGDFFGAFFGGGPNWAGEPMNAEIAMRLTFVWKCVRLISSTLASLPYGLVAADGSGKRPGADVAVGDVISTSPNANQTAVEFWESIIGCMELVGNGFARKEFSGSGPSRQVIALTLMNPYGVQPVKLPGRELFWRYTDDDGKQTELSRDEVFHLKQFSFDGMVGLSTVSYGAQTLSGARAADRTAAQMFSTGLSSSGFLETAQVLDEPDRQRLQKIMDEYRGSGGIGKLMILEAGMKYNAISLSAQDAQLLTSRKWNGEEICRLFDVPPILAGHSPEGGTMWGSGVEQVVLAWYMLGLRNRIRRIQAATAKQLLNPTQRAAWQPKFNIDGLLQGDSNARANLFSTYTQNGIMSRNEARRLLDLPPYVGGDEFTAQVNLAPVATLGDKSAQDAVSARSWLRNFLGVEDARPAAPPQITDQRDR